MMQLFYLAATKINASDAGVPKVSASDALAGILTTVYTVAGIIAVISIIIGGLVYVLSAGDPSKVKLGKDIIVYAAVGLVVVMMAFLITNFIIGSF